MRTEEIADNRVDAPTILYDTNVLVAELAFPDEPAVCVGLAESGDVELAVSPPLLREFAAVLAYDHLPLADRAPERRAEAVERVVAAARVVEPVAALDVAADPDDDAVVEAALAADAEAVVSDDAHLRELDGVCGVGVRTREAFLEERTSERRTHRNSEDDGGVESS